MFPATANWSSKLRIERQPQDVLKGGFGAVCQIETNEGIVVAVKVLLENGRMAPRVLEVRLGPIHGQHPLAGI